MKTMGLGTDDTKLNNRLQQLEETVERSEQNLSATRKEIAQIKETLVKRELILKPIKEVLERAEAEDLRLFILIRFKSRVSVLGLFRTDYGRKWTAGAHENHFSTSLYVEDILVSLDGDNVLMMKVVVEPDIGETIREMFFMQVGKEE